MFVHFCCAKNTRTNVFSFHRCSKWMKKKVSCCSECRACYSKAPMSLKRRIPIGWWEKLQGPGRKGCVQRLVLTSVRREEEDPSQTRTQPELVTTWQRPTVKGLSIREHHQSFYLWVRRIESDLQTWRGQRTKCLLTGLQTGSRCGGQQVISHLGEPEVRRKTPIVAQPHPTQSQHGSGGQHLFCTVTDNSSCLTQDSGLRDLHCDNNDSNMTF